MFFNFTNFCRAQMNQKVKPKLPIKSKPGMNQAYKSVSPVYLISDSGCFFIIFITECLIQHLIEFVQTKIF